MSQPSYEALMQTVFREVERVQNYSREERLAYMRASGLVPPNFPDGKGQFFFTTKEGTDALRQIGLLWRSESKDRQRRLNEEHAQKLSAEVMGEALAEGLWEKRNDPRSAWTELRGRFEARLLQASRDIEHSFPCQILKDTAVGAFAMGPVTFRPRLEWLDHVEATAGRKPDWAEPVRAVWTGKAELPTDSTHVSLEVRSITDHFVCPWIATVNVEGNDIGRSKERGRIAVRLAIDALGAVLEHRHALTLRAPGDRLTNANDATFAQSHEGYLAMGESFDLPGLDVKPGLGHDFVTGTTRYRDAAGKAIASFVALSPADKPGLYQRWCDALFWFGNARRDTEGFMALTRYGMSLDILAKGARANGITSLLSALLAIKPEDAFLKDGTSLKKTVKRIYDEGRSQFGHGGRAALLEDLPFSRLGADTIAMLAIERYVLCLAEYGGTDTYEVFLNAIPSLLAKVTS